MGPVQLIGALEHQHLALIFQRAGAQHHVIFALVDKHLRVAHMAGEPGGVVLVVQKALLAGHSLAVVADGKADVVPAALFDVVEVAGVLHVAGIVEVHLGALDER